MKDPVKMDNKILKDNQKQSAVDIDSNFWER